MHPGSTPSVTSDAVRMPSDMPRPSRRERRRERGPRPNRGRLIVGIVIALVVVLALSLRAIATFWTDFLWFDSLDMTAVWRRLLSAKVTLGIGATLAFFLLLWVNLLVADRLAPKFRPLAGPEDEILVRYRELVTGRQRVMEIGLALLVAIIPGISASGQWREWLLFRYGGSFGRSDPQFGTDIGFYIFKLPFLSQVIDWVFGFLIVTAVIVAVVHYLNGAIRLQPMGERVTPNAKAHLSVLLALAALVKAADYWLQRYELTFAQGKSFDGAGYTAVNARLPAIQLLILISVFVAILLLVNIWRRGWVLPVIVVALWALVAVVVGSAYPAFVQRFQVSPSELAKEKPYIQRNITATREALGLSDVAQTNFDYQKQMTQQKIDAQSSNVTNARLLDPEVIKPTIQELEFQREYYQFKDVDVDRYVVDDGNGTAPTRDPVVISTRELNSQGIQNPTWEKLHLVFTHGYGAAVAPANSVNERGEPDFIVSGIPAQSDGVPQLKQPEIYHGEGMTGYAIVGTDQKELSTDQVTTTYTGKSGVPINTFFRKAAFALRFGEIEPLISSNLTSKSKIIFNRDIRERVQTLAPFLTLDADPYPVMVDGRIKYVLDGYTTASTYPYAEQQDPTTIDATQTDTFNYISNSVKAVVDAYDGTVTMYLSDTLYGHKDPIIRAYAKAFPGLFESDIPESLSRHFRYPELLFKAQTQVWGKYHQSNPSSFFNNSDRWDIAQEPPSSSTAETASNATDAAGQTTQLKRIDPYYQLMQLQPGDDPQFVLTRPFVLASTDDSGRNLTAMMIASNDPGSYGKLRQVVMTTTSSDGKVEQNTKVDGPLRANQKIVTYGPVSTYQTLVGRSGSTVQFGNLLILPFKDSLLYVRPVYAKEEQSGRFTLKKVAVTSGDQVGFGDNIDFAIADLLDGNDDGAVGQPAVNPVTGEPDTSTPTTTVPPSTTPDGRTATQLLADADQKFTDADAKLKAGDLGGYQADVRAAHQLVQQATAAIGAGAPTTTAPAAPATTAPPAPTTTAPPAAGDQASATAAPPGRT